MDKDQRHALNELRDRVGRSLDLFYDKIGKHHHAVSGRVAVDFHPPAEVNERDADLEISLELPGIDGDNVEVTRRSLCAAAVGSITPNWHGARTVHGDVLTPIDNLEDLKEGKAPVVVAGQLGQIGWLDGQELRHG